MIPQVKMRTSLDKLSVIASILRKKHRQCRPHCMLRRSGQIIINQPNTSASSLRQALLRSVLPLAAMAPLEQIDILPKSIFELLFFPHALFASSRVLRYILVVKLFQILFSLLDDIPSNPLARWPPKDTPERGEDAISSAVPNATEEVSHLEVVNALERQAYQDVYDRRKQNSRACASQVVATIATNDDGHHAWNRGNDKRSEASSRFIGLGNARIQAAYQQHGAQCQQEQGMLCSIDVAPKPSGNAKAASNIKAAETTSDQFQTFRTLS